MPYRGITDLEDNLRSKLPKHAQEIYVKAYNSAYEEYKDPDDRRHDDDSQEKTAHRVAWAAVKKSYEKGDDEKWHRKAK